MTTISNAVPPLDRAPMGAPAGRQAFKDLAIALKSGDLDDARQAYVQVVKNAPEGATWNPEGSFAELGRALKAGDITAAQEIAKAALKDRRPNSPPSIPVSPAPLGAPSTTGRSSGSHLNVVA